MDHLAQIALLFTRVLPSLLAGFAITIEVALAAAPLALALGLCLLPFRLAPPGILRALSGVYVEVMRNTPLLLQIYLIYFGLPVLGLFPSEFTCGVLGIALQHGAFFVEIYRSGIDAVSQRQWEAARAIGMVRGATLRHVILPQALLRILGPLGNQLIILAKDTSLVSAIGVAELTMTGKVAIERTAITIDIFVAIAVLYLVLTTALGAGLRVAEARVAERLG